MKLISTFLIALSFSALAQDTIEDRIAQRLSHLNDLVNQGELAKLGLQEKQTVLLNINSTIQIVRGRTTPTPAPVPSPGPTYPIPGTTCALGFGTESHNQDLYHLYSVNAYGDVRTVIGWSSSLNAIESLLNKSISQGQCNQTGLKAVCTSSLANGVWHLYMDIGNRRFVTWYRSEYEFDKVFAFLRSVGSCY